MRDACSHDAWLWGRDVKCPVRQEVADLGAGEAELVEDLHSVLPEEWGRAERDVVCVVDPSTKHVDAPHGRVLAAGDHVVGDRLAVVDVR